MLKRLNWVHILILLALPIVLALINPNWLFNVNMADDFNYLGYQMNFPKYTGWYPSADIYLIERLSIILPGYFIRQFASPLIANFVVHLGVYYLAIFSVYGILNRLFTAKVALIIALLFGQYPLIMRASGWDYPDGYAMAYFALTIFFLTYSVGSKRQFLYLAGAGGAFVLMINAHFFNVFYFPAILTYYLLINGWKNPLQTLIAPVIFGGAGALMMYAGLALIYYAFTERLLLANAIETGDSIRWLKFFLIFNFSKTPAHWHFLFLTPAIILIGRPALWKKMSFIPAEKPQFANMRVVMRALVGLFAVSYLVLVIWQFMGFIYIRVSYYQANLVVVTFLVVGALFSQRLIAYPPAKFKYLVAGAFFIPMIPLALFSLSPQSFYITNHWLLYGGGVVCMVIALHPKRTLYALFGFVMCAGGMLNDARGYQSWLFPAYTDVYVADRYMGQRLYEYTIAMSDIFSARYESFNYETFRIFHLKGGDTHSRLFNSVAAVFLWTWHRDRVLNPETLLTEAQETGEIVVMSSVNQTEALLTQLYDAVDVTEVERHVFSHQWGDIELIFFRVNKGF